jgi:mono/diheme cytochrome c family protein
MRAAYAYPLIVCGVALCVTDLSRVALADEAAVTLKDAPDAAFVAGKCSICHSADYIQMNAPFMKRAAWEAEVRKMVKVMGAPLEEADFARVVDYLTKQYGSE